MHDRTAAQVHVWRADLQGSDSFVASCRALLSESELARAARLHRPADRARLIISHGLRRCILADYLEVEPATLRFESGPHGKPRVATEAVARALAFNVSRTDVLMVIAITPGPPVGVDVACTTGAVDEVAVAQRFFLAADARAVAQAQAPHRRELFFRLWTRLEAVLKAQGCGLAGRETEGGMPPDGWEVGEFTPGPHHLAALALQRRTG